MLQGSHHFGQGKMKLAALEVSHIVRHQMLRVLSVIKNQEFMPDPSDALPLPCRYEREHR